MDKELKKLWGDQVEEWRDIEKYEEMYQVSNIGNVRGIDRIVKSRGNMQRVQYGRILKPGRAKSGYMTVSLQSKTHTVHRLVLLAFKGVSPLHTNHKNGNKEDNRLENLEYCTQAYNNRHAFRSGLIVAARGERASKSKLTENQVLKIREIYEWEIGKYSRIRDRAFSFKWLGRAFNVHRSAIADIVYRRSWSHL